MSKFRIAIAGATVIVAMTVGVIGNLTAQECNCINGYTGFPGLRYLDQTGWHCRDGGCYIITAEGKKNVIKSGAKGERMRPVSTGKFAPKTARVRTSRSA